MVIFEDLHWIDESDPGVPESARRFDRHGEDSAAGELSARVLASMEQQDLLHSASARPPGQGLGAKRCCRLCLATTQELVPLKRVIIERTEGNPFFMEETVQVLLDEGALVRNGVTHLTRPISELKIPPTVQGILAARIDRLPHGREGSVANAGRHRARISAVADSCGASTKSDDELNRMLNDLQLGEFIYEQPAVGDTEYIFKHALTQEVSYNSVLLERRKQLHERIGAAIEALYANSIEDHLDELAHHYSRSGNVPKALEYQERAGRQALQRSAYTDAMRALTAALELLMRLPESPQRDQRELGLQTTLGPVLMITKGWAAPETERVSLRVQELADTGGTPAQRYFLLTGLFGTAYVRGRFAEARGWLEQTRSFTSQHPEPEFVLELHHRDWSLALSTGELVAAQRHVEEGLAFYHAHPGSVPITPLQRPSSSRMRTFVGRYHFMAARLSGRRAAAG